MEEKVRHKADAPRAAHHFFWYLGQQTQASTTPVKPMGGKRQRELRQCSSTYLHSYRFFAPPCSRLSTYPLSWDDPLKATAAPSEGPRAACPAASSLPCTPRHPPRHPPGERFLGQDTNTEALCSFLKPGQNREKQLGP